MIKDNVTLQKIKAGLPVIGTFVKFFDPASIEILGANKLDFFVVDNEHIAMDARELCNIFRTAELSGITPVLRLPKNNQELILQALDAGATGIQAPNIDNPQQAADLVAFTCYAPHGKRGFAPTTRAALYGIMDRFEYVKKSNANILTIAHCESKTSVENIEAIAATTGLDVVFIGPMDLSASYGHIGQPDHPEVQTAIAKIEKAVLNAGKALGTVCAPNQIADFIKRGYGYLCVGSDHGMVNSGAQAIRKQIDLL